MLPECIGELTELQVLELNVNELHGHLPTSLGKLDKLRRLWLQNFNCTNKFVDPRPVQQQQDGMMLFNTRGEIESFFAHLAAGR
mmetsp:Transcript_69284/g.193841  ORF Transcript_69284/g.193841 Transcript_69284/m.193841 type:complete len:84 (+) Transcript_69284:2037-2288(+)